MEKGGEETREGLGKQARDRMASFVSQGMSLTEAIAAEFAFLGFPAAKKAQVSDHHQKASTRFRNETEGDRHQKAQSSDHFQEAAMRFRNETD